MKKQELNAKYGKVFNVDFTKSIIDAEERAYNNLKPYAKATSFFTDWYKVYDFKPNFSQLSLDFKTSYANIYDAHRRFCKANNLKPRYAFYDDKDVAKMMVLRHTYTYEELSDYFNISISKVQEMIKEGKRVNLCK